MIDKKALEKLAVDFGELDLTFHEFKEGSRTYRMSLWPGEKNEDVMICVFKGKYINEPYHRQDFFFINYAYENGFETQNSQKGQLLKIHEQELYIGQPYSPYALRLDSDEESTIIGILIRKDAFFKDFIGSLSKDESLFYFFMDPKKDKYSERYLHLSFLNDTDIRSLFELLVNEYAYKKEDTQPIIKSLVMGLLLQIARRYRLLREQSLTDVSVSEQIIFYMDSHSDIVTLKEIADRFGYHPNYISSLLRKQTGKKFSQILLEKRMDRASLLLGNKDISIEDIVSILGYSDHSNFYKAFKSYYGMTPKEYADSLK